MFFLYLAFPSKAAELFLFEQHQISAGDHSLLSCAHQPGQLELVGLVCSKLGRGVCGVVSGEIHGPVLLGSARRTPAPSVLPALHHAPAAGQDSVCPTPSKATLPPSTPLSTMSSMSLLGFKLNLW